jgi:hypothetical protein
MLTIPYRLTFCVDTSPRSGEYHSRINFGGIVVCGVCPTPLCKKLGQQQS